MARDAAVDEEREADTQGNADEHHHGVEQTGDAGDVVLVGNVAYAVGEGHSGHQGDDGPHEDVAEVMAEAQPVGEEADEGDDGSAADVAENLGEARGGDAQHEHVEEKSRHEGHCAVGKASAEDDAEGSAADGGGDDLLPEGTGRHAADGTKVLARLGKRVAPVLNVARQLVHGHHLVELRALEGDILDVGEAAARGEDAVAEHEEVAAVHAVVRRDALHGLLHTRNLCAVFQQDVTRFRGYLKGFGSQPPVVVHKGTVHIALQFGCKSNKNEK